MPYAIRKTGSSDKPFCVFNTETDENKGCSDSRQKAVGHLKALYAAENKDLNDKQIDELVIKAVAEYQREYDELIPPEEVFDKDYYEASYPSVYVGASTSYEEYEELKKAWAEARKVEELLDMFPTLARNAMFFAENTENKANLIESLSNELADRIRSVSADDSDVKAISKREDVGESERKRAVAEYGDVKYADPKNKKYPIDTPAHIRAAWNYINMPRNAGKYSSSEVSSIKSRIVSAWKKKISKDGPPSAKEIKNDLALFAEYSAYYLKSLLGMDNEEVEDDLMFWKDKDSGRMMWLARYSNNFLDNDNPPDIISERSHRRFVEMVDKGVYPYPDLWLWHQKEWSIGKAVWCAYDDSGFAVAAGYIYPDCEQVVDELSQLKDVSLSHGMPASTVVRDDEDERVIVEHQTKEISVLPLWAAANKLTSFELLKGDGDMLPKDKRKQAITRWGMSEDLLDRLEKLNVDSAKEASEEGIESKEKSELETASEPVVESTSEETSEEVTKVEKEEETKVEGEETQTETEETVDLDRPPSIKEVADAIANVFSPQIDALIELQGKVESLTKQVEGLASQVGKVEEEQKHENEVTNTLMKTTPVAAMMSMFERQRAVGSEEATVKKGELEDAPAQSEDSLDKRPTGIEFIDRMLTQPQKS